jgi:hypothetical protein
MCHREVQSSARKDVKTRGLSQFIVCLLWILQPVVALSVKNLSLRVKVVFMAAVAAASSGRHCLRLSQVERQGGWSLSSSEVREKGLFSLGRSKQDSKIVFV